jgi:ankyrin repeat protein
MTALHTAAAAGSAGCCELLLARADMLLEAKTAKGWAALMFAARKGHLEHVRLLLQHGADVNAVNCNGCNALMTAVHTADTAVAQLLLDHGADANATDLEGHNALFKATLGGNVSMMELLVQHGLSATTVDNLGQTLLIIAAHRGHTAVAEWLLQRGVAVNAVENEGFTALHSACVSNVCDNAAMVELLLANGADVNQCARGEHAALEAAADSGNVHCARVLTAAGANVNHSDSDGITSLHVAATAQHSAIVQLLLEHGATAVIKIVIPKRCCTDAHCCASVTALMLCTDADTVKLLLAAGADVHITNHVGDTCLHVPAKHNWVTPMLCLLIKAGANLHAVNNEGKTAAQLAHERGYTLIEQLLNRAAQQSH